MKTIQQIEAGLTKQHDKLFTLFATSSLERACILSALVAAYLRGYNEAADEANAAAIGHFSVFSG